MSTLQKDNSGTIEAAVFPASALSSLEATAFHQVEDKELRVLMKEKSLPLISAAVFFGVFFGTALQAGEAILNAMSGTAPADPEGMMYVVLASLSLGVGIASTIVVLRRRSQIIYALEAIRKRSTDSLLPGKKSGFRRKR